MRFGSRLSSLSWQPPSSPSPRSSGGCATSRTFWPATSTASRSPRAAICARGRRCARSRVHRSVRSLAGHRCERRSLLRHRQRREGLPASRHRLKLVLPAPEPEIYALAFHDGALYAASSPNGKIYRIDPESGKEARLLRSESRRTSGRCIRAGRRSLGGHRRGGKALPRDAERGGEGPLHTRRRRTSADRARKDGTILAGGSGRDALRGPARRLLACASTHSVLNEISSVYVDSNGMGWAAGVSNVLPAAAPTKPGKPAAQPSATSTSSGTTA